MQRGILWVLDVELKFCMPSPLLLQAFSTHQRRSGPNAKFDRICPRSHYTENRRFASRFQLILHNSLHRPKAQLAY